jgi:polyhydroxyalkanoate synthase subunit PhaC
MSRITCSLLNIAATRDHIVPLPQTEPTLALVSSRDAEYLPVDAGHVGLLAGSEARNLLWPRVQGWLTPRSR